WRPLARAASIMVIVVDTVAEDADAADLEVAVVTVETGNQAVAVEDIEAEEMHTRLCRLVNRQHGSRDELEFCLRCTKTSFDEFAISVLRVNIILLPDIQEFPYYTSTGRLDGKQALCVYLFLFD